MPLTDGPHGVNILGRCRGFMRRGKRMRGLTVAAVQRSPNDVSALQKKTRLIAAKQTSTG